MKKKLISIYLCLLITIPLISVSAIANEPPAIPTIDGPPSGKPGESYDYTFTSIDPDGDDVFYMVSWGCCGPGQDFHSYGPYESGIPTTISKTYNEKGTYIITAYAKDTNNAESDTTTLEVSMPRSHQIIQTLFMRFIEQYPNTFPVLQKLLGL